MRRGWDLPVRVLAVGLALLATTLGVPGAARARGHGRHHGPSADKVLARAVSDYDNLDYDKTEAALTKLLANEKALTHAQLIEALTYLAYAQTLQGEDDRAGDTFGRLLDADPTFTVPPTVSPRIQSVFAGVKKARGPAPVVAPTPTPKPVAPSPPRPVTLSHTVAPTNPVAGQTVTVHARLVDPDDRVASVTLFYRHPGDAGYSREPAKRPPGAKGLGEVGLDLPIPGPFVAAPAVQLYLTAQDAAGTDVASDGSAALPLSVSVQPAPRSLLASPWFWGGVGAGVAAAVVAGLLLTAHPSPSGPATVTLQPQ